MALQVLQDAGFETAGLRSKSWEEFLKPDSAPIDLVITVCGVAEQSCPVFPGRPATAHWGFDDPSAGDAPDDFKMAAFRQTLIQIKHRIELFVSLPDASLERMALEQSARALAGQ
jgi:protein-tyrosine-phosphatase